MIMFGRSVGLPWASMRLRHRHFNASPASMMASDEPMVDTPTPSSGAWKSRDTMLMQRFSISAVCGYSSLSIMFLAKHSVISFSAWGSIQVVTKVARLSRALPSSSSSSWMSW